MKRSHLIATLVLMVLMVGGAFGLAAEPAQQQASQVVRITAERFLFTPAEVSVALGTEIEFQLTSHDTAHGFRILGQSIDLAIPKRGRGAATVRFAPPGPGTYVFECSRMCGAGHSFMRGTIHVREPADRK